jgi:hypothetical protein
LFLPESPKSYSGGVIGLREAIYFHLYLKKSNPMKILFTLLFSLSVCIPAFSQKTAHTRIQVDFSIKEKKGDGKGLLTMGKLYYDIKEKKIVYLLKFPEKEVWVEDPKNSYYITGDKLIKKEKNPIAPDNSLIHMCLTNTLFDYGLTRSPYYKVSLTEKTDTSETVTYRPLTKSTELYGKIILYHQDHKLVSMLLYDDKAKLTGKLFFKKYQLTGDLTMPMEILTITYPDDKGTEDFQLTTYSNVLTDSSLEDATYKYKIPSK